MTSTTIPAAASGRNTWAWIPGLSEIPCSVILASSFVAVTPATTTDSMAFSSGTTHVPSLSLKLDRTWMRTAVLHPELDRADLQHLGAQRRQLQHLLVADAVDLARRADDVGVGGVDAVDVGVDLAGVGLERGRHGDRRGVRAAAAQRGDVAVLVDALEPGDDRDLAGLERGVDGARVDVLDARARERAVGEDAHLVPQQRDGAAALGLDGQRQQADRDLLAGRGDDVQLALVGQLG